MGIEIIMTHVLTHMKSKACESHDDSYGKVKCFCESFLSPDRVSLRLDHPLRRPDPAKKYDPIQ